MKKKKNFRIKIHERQLFDQYEEVCYEKTQMDEGGCLCTQCRFDHGLVCRTGFCRMDTGGARAYIINGQVQTGWQQIDGKWYYLNEQGAPQIGWVKDGEKQYFCTASGEMVSGVVWINGKTYYFGTPDSGEMATGVVSINGIPYTFENDGTSFGGRKPRPARSFEVKVAEDGTMTILETTNADTPKLNSRTSKERRHSGGGGGSETPSVVPSDAPATKEPTENPTPTVKPTQPEETKEYTTTEPPQTTTEPPQTPDPSEAPRSTDP